jgi:hypothetical protein
MFLTLKDAPAPNPGCRTVESGDQGWYSLGSSVPAMHGTPTAVPGAHPCVMPQEWGCFLAFPWNSCLLVHTYCVSVPVCDRPVSAHLSLLEPCGDCHGSLSMTCRKQAHEVGGCQVPHPSWRSRPGLPHSGCSLSLALQAQVHLGSVRAAGSLAASRSPQVGPITLLWPGLGACPLLFSA